MSTLWNKGTAATEEVENFTVGEDRILDLKLARYDVLGSQAHIKMLASIGLLTKEELDILLPALDEILASIDDGAFTLEDDVEDIHSQVELLLTRKLGEVGKKIHSGRSRNDQVLVDIKLYLRDELLSIRQEVFDLFTLLQSLSEKHKDVLIPGYTHSQIATPSSIGLWLGGYAELLCDDMRMLRGAYQVVNRNPLGSAAGYGSSFPLDRQMTSDLLGFESPVYNSIAAQAGRGKSEKAVASAIGSLALTLNRLAADCCMYMCQNYGFIHFPDSLTTGSSIMPHKKNPDVWEIIRGRCNMIMNTETQVSMLCGNLPHGYHRDLQLLKDILFPRLDDMHDCIRMAHLMLSNLEVKEGILENPLYEHIFTVEEVNKRVLQGTPFRDAYKGVGIEVNEGRFHYNQDQISVASLGHCHLGSIGNLATELIALQMAEASDWK